MLFGHDKSQPCVVCVMLVEIPDPEVWLGVIIAFFVGLFVLYLIYKIKPLINVNTSSHDQYESDRLEYYERQLIDMKIRLDALDISNTIEKPVETYQKPTQTVDMQEVRQESITKSDNLRIKQRSVGYVDVANHVLELITTKPMTSRDIQITIGRSREHTSRLMNKLYKDGYVQRNTNSKPYSYSITENGRVKLGK